MFRVVSNLGAMQHVYRHVQRNIGVTAIVAEAAGKRGPPPADAASSRADDGGFADPIQKLFLSKIREYKTKSAGGKLVDATPEVEARLKDALDKVDRMYNAKGQDMTKFPTFNFPAPKLEPVGLGETKDIDEDAFEEELQVEEDNKPYFQR